MLESLKELSDRATPGAWTYPDYGTDFRTGKTTIGMTSPAFEGNGRANRAFIVALVNAYRREELYDATALAEAEARGRRQGLEEAAIKAEGQLAYWRERMRAEKCLEDGVSDDGQAYTPIGDVAAWEGGYCNGRMGEAEWWIGTLRSLATAPAETQKPEETA